MTTDWHSKLVMHSNLSLEGSPAEPPRPAHAAPLAGIHIVLVEDHEDSRELARYILESAGASVASTASVREAMVAIGSKRPDLIVSDIGMPGEDGYALMRRIRKLPARDGGSVPAIALSAFVLVEDRQAALEAGFHVCLAKPFNPAGLIEAAVGLAKTSLEEP